MFNNKMSLQQDAHTMKSKESFTAFLRDRVIPKAFSHRSTLPPAAPPQITPKRQSSFLLTYIHTPAIFKITNCISRLLLSEDKYPICKLDFFLLALLIVYLLDDSRDNHPSLQRKQLNSYLEADFKEIMVAIPLRRNILFPLHQRDSSLFLFLSSSQWEKWRFQKLHSQSKSIL